MIALWPYRSGSIRDGVPIMQIYLRSTIKAFYRVLQSDYRLLKSTIQSLKVVSTA